MTESYEPYTATLPDGTEILVQCYDGVPTEVAVREDGRYWGIPTRLEAAR